MSSFPGDVTTVLAEKLGTLPGLSQLDYGNETKPASFMRPLRPSDPAVCIGTFVIDWEPGEQELGFSEPMLSTYVWAVQLLVKHGDEQEGLNLHSNLSKQVRSMLYGHGPLRVALTALNENNGEGRLERVGRWGVRTQRYANNEIDGNFVYLSTTDFWLQTETL